MRRVERVRNKPAHATNEEIRNPRIGLTKSARQVSSRKASLFRFRVLNLTTIYHLQLRRLPLREVYVFVVNSDRFLLLGSGASLHTRCNSSKRSLSFPRIAKSSPAALLELYNF